MIGASAVLMWATLALLTTLSGDVPPFQLVAMSFSIAFSLALVKWLGTEQSVIAMLKWPARARLVRDARRSAKPSWSAL